ncbi:MAG TPA: response regulator transcription factor [Pyrinomonadaceae bacterium]
MPHRLLIVNDEPHLLRKLESCLGPEGFDVVTARTGRDALIKIAQAVPDLIISDTRLPGMSGFELARHLRESPRSALVPLIFLTARAESGDRIEGFRAGVDAYLTKPFVTAELVAMIRSILSRVERTHAQIARLIGRSLKDGDVLQDDILTEREKGIAASVARGLTNKEIAAEMAISVRTVENHISHILDKKHFNNRVEIARYVMERGA